MKSTLIPTILCIVLLTLLTACGSSKSVLSGNFTEFDGSFDGIAVELSYYSRSLGEPVGLGSGVVEENVLEVDISYDEEVPRWAFLSISHPDAPQRRINFTLGLSFIIEQGAHYTLDVIDESEILFRIESDGMYAHLFVQPVEVVLEEHDLINKMDQARQDELNSSPLPSEHDSLDTTVREPSEHASVLDWENMSCADYAGEYEQSWRSTFFSPNRRQVSEAVEEVSKQLDEFYRREYEQPALITIDSTTDPVEKLLLIERGYDVEIEKTIQILKELVSELPDYVVEERVQPFLNRMLRQQELRQANEALELGTIFPPLDITLMDQTTTPLNSILQKSQIVVLDLWDNYCPPCLDGFKRYQHFYSEYVSLGFEVVSLSLERDPAAWLEKLEELKLPWTNSIAPGGYDGDISTKLGIRFPRANFVLDSEGCILKRNLSPDELLDFLGARLGS